MKSEPDKCLSNEDIDIDPNDPLDEIGHFPGLDRLMFLIPCVINRLWKYIFNPDKLEITNYKRQITNKLQIQPCSFTKCAGWDLSFDSLYVSACLRATHRQACRQVI